MSVYVGQGSSSTQTINVKYVHLSVRLVMPRDVCNVPVVKIICLGKAVC